MAKDKSLADRLRQVLITCGKKETVVRDPATKPMISVYFEGIMQSTNLCCGSKK
jgi:hypothetical protein